MLDIDAQAELANATTALMRTCAVVTAQTMTASALRGLTLWSELLRAPGPRHGAAATRTSEASRADTLWRVGSPADWMPKFGSWPLGAWTPGALSGWDAYTALWTRPANTAWGPFYGDWASWSRAYWNGSRGSDAVLPVATRVASPAIYASYRSAGGHATAQVIVPAARRSPRA